MLPSKSIIYKKSQTYYQKYGNGSQKIMCFHGFGLDKSTFASFSKSMVGATFFAFDLPFHGQTTIEDFEGDIFRTNFHHTIALFLLEENIDRFSVMGFSMGARFAIELLLSYKERVNKIYMLAPDGIKPNFWNRLVIRSVVLQKVFKYLIYKPKTLILLLKILLNLKLLEKGAAKFIISEVETEEKRNRLYGSWSVVKALNFEEKDVVSMLYKHEIPCICVSGKQDLVISVSKIETFVQKLNIYQHIILDCGHAQIISKYSIFVSKIKL